jgi:hypothetical protein
MGSDRYRRLCEVQVSPAPELVNIADIAARLGVARGTVDTWRWRGRAGFAFPTPVAETGRPVWKWSAVRSWARAVGLGDRVAACPTCGTIGCRLRRKPGHAPYDRQGPA